MCSLLTCENQWSALNNFYVERRNNKAKWDEYKKKLDKPQEVGIIEKRAAISKTLRELEHTEKVIIEAGAKTFVEMYPDLPKPQEQQPYFYRSVETEPYETKLRFRIPDLNDEKKEGYKKLFEAAWNNDLDTIKSLTLKAWKSASGSANLTPLRVAVQDGNGFRYVTLCLCIPQSDTSRGLHIILLQSLQSLTPKVLHGVKSAIWF